MTALAIAQPLPQFFDISGDPLSAGKIYLGTPYLNPETNPVTVYWDAAATQPAAQPLRTLNGYVVRNGTPAAVFVAGDYSLTVRDRRGRLVITAPTSTAYSLLAYLGTESGAQSINFTQLGSGAITRNLLDKLREVKSVADFGAVGDGVTDDTAAIQKALDACLELSFGDNTKNYKIAGTLVCRSHHKLRFNGARMFQTLLQTPLLNAKNTEGVTIQGGNFTGVSMTIATAGAFVIGRKYTIVTVGTTNFTAIGAASNTPGVIFTATGAGTGTGTATTLYNNPNSQDIGIAGDYATNLRVIGNTFNGFAYSALMVAFWGTNIWFERNTVIGPGQTVLNPLGGDPSIPGLRNCTGVTILGYGVYITRNTFSDTSQGLIVGQQSRDVFVSHNTIKRTWVEHGMYLDAGIKNAVVAQNNVSNTALIGMKVQWYDAIPDIPENISFIGNNIMDCGGDAIIALNAGQTTIANLTGVTQANPGVFTTGAAHGLAVNDVINISGVLGMTPVNAMYYVASVPSSTTFTVKVMGTPLDTTSFPAYISGGAISRPTFARNVNITGNTVRRCGQDAVGMRFVNGGTLAENDVDGVTRAGVYVLYGRTVDLNNNIVRNTGTNGIYCLQPTDRNAITDNTLINVGSDGNDSAGLSAGILVDGSGGAELDNNTISGAEPVQMATINAITKANPGVFTTTAAHGLQPGQIVTIAGVTGMTSVNGLQTIFSTPTPTTFTIGVGTPLDTTALPAYVSGGTVTLVKMQYGIFIASGDKRQYAVRKNTVTIARDAGLRCHTDDTYSLGYLGNDNIFEAQTGNNTIVGLPVTVPGRGSPNPRYYGTAVPVSGFWTQGATLEILYPAAGTPKEYECVASGTPGTWIPSKPTQAPNAYSVTNPTTDRALNVTADTLTQVAAVLGTLIADLKTSGVLK